MNKPRLVLSVCFCSIFVTPTFLLAQAGTSSMAMEAGRAGVHRTGLAGQYMMPAPDMLRVEEFINYHRHDLPWPDDGQRVRMDVQRMMLDNGKSVYQFGLTTPRAVDPELVPPLNIVLVIDRSGSIARMNGRD